VAPIDVKAGQAIYADTDTLGAYVVEQFLGDKLIARQRFAVNLFSKAESTIGPQPELKIQQTSGLQQATAGERVGRQEFWRWLAALALVVLVIEWLVYQRNGIAYLRQRWRARRAGAG
jgi:Ca-activated chloride channel homolog